MRARVFMAVASSWQPRSLLPRRASHEGMNVVKQ